MCCLSLGLACASNETCCRKAGCKLPSSNWTTCVGCLVPVCARIVLQVFQSLGNYNIIQSMLVVVIGFSAVHVIATRLVSVLLQQVISSTVRNVSLIFLCLWQLLILASLLYLELLTLTFRASYCMQEADMVEYRQTYFSWTETITDTTIYQSLVQQCYS